MGPALPYIGVALAAIGTASSISQGRKARMAQERSERARQNLAKFENRRQAVAALTRARAQRADIVAGAEAQGASGSSAVAGGTGALASGTANELSFLSSAEAAGGFISQQNIFAGAAQTRAANYAAAGELGYNVFTNPSLQPAKEP